MAPVITSALTTEPICTEPERAAADRVTELIQESTAFADFCASSAKDVSEVRLEC